jgi:putative addiction module antidote
MVREIKLRQVGGSVGATLPKDMADRLQLAVGDSVLAIETDRGILLTPYDPAVEDGLAIAARAARRYRHALREFAKQADGLREPRWVPRILVEAVHFDQVRIHGGLTGVRDDAALESALARPRNRFAYGRNPDLASLAAAYACDSVADPASHG